MIKNNLTETGVIQKKHPKGIDSDNQTILVELAKSQLVKFTAKGSYCSLLGSLNLQSVTTL